MTIVLYNDIINTMRISRKKKRTQRFFLTNLIIVILLFAIVMLAQSVWSVYKKSEYAGLKKEKANKELTALRERAGLLEKEAERIKTSRGAEAEIRQRFDVGKDGEKLIILLDSPEKPKPAKTQIKKTWWQKIIGLF